MNSDNHRSSHRTWTGQGILVSEATPLGVLLSNKPPNLLPWFCIAYFFDKPHPLINHLVLPSGMTRIRQNIIP
jgi:hypothetical protein